MKVPCRASLLLKNSTDKAVIGSHGDRIGSLKSVSDGDTKRISASRFQGMTRSEDPYPCRYDPLNLFRVKNRKLYKPRGLMEWHVHAIPP